MSRLFMALYLDEDVDVLVADVIRARGFIATTTQEAGQVRNTDAAQLRHAVSQQSALLTHNRVDFEALAQAYLLAGQTHYGILIAVRRPPHEIARRLLRLLNAVPAEEMHNQVRYL